MAGPDRETPLGAVGVYLASPLGFTPYGARFHKEVVTAVLDVGFAPVDPWDTTEGAELARLLATGAGYEQLAAANAATGLANELLIDRAAAVLACLDGPDVDSGTAAEIGYAAAQGKPTFGYRLDSRRSGEDLASTVNLQVEHFVRRNGGSLHLSFSSALQALQEHFA